MNRKNTHSALSDKKRSSTTRLSTTQEPNQMPLALDAESDPVTASPDSASAPLDRQPLDRQPLDRQPLDRQPLDRQPLDRQPLDSASLFDTLALWVELGWLRQLDRHFAVFLADHDADADPLVWLAAALVSHQAGRGHVCLSLARALSAPHAALSLPPLDGGREPETPVPLPETLLAGVSSARWRAALEASRLVAPAAQAARSATPLVLDGELLYLRRYWQAEHGVAGQLRERLGGALPVAAAMAEPLRALFAGNAPASQETDSHEPENHEPDWQRIACALALRQRLTVISGGPGTGKTTTVTRLLALLQQQALNASGEALRIRLAAPTGKAAARLSESIAGAVSRLEIEDAVRAAIPLDAQTLHRLLGARPDTRHFRHHRDRPLSVDLLVVDEASMVDLEMMAALLDALPADARLILLGDKDQLASVEAGSVLGDLCEGAALGAVTQAGSGASEEPGSGPAEKPGGGGVTQASSGASAELGVGGSKQPGSGGSGKPGYSAPVRAYLETMTGDTLPVAASNALADHVAMLRKSFRFRADSGIGELARAANAGDGRGVVGALKAGFEDLATHDAEGAAFERAIVAGYRELFQAMQAGAEADTLLRLQGRFQVLCALRRGAWGVEGLNQRIALALQRQGWIAQTDGWYAGRPVMVTHNDPQLGLYNGDLGLTLADAQGRLRVCFPHADGIRQVLPSRLDAAATAFAMTVHKSQGSEFEHVLFVLPARPNPIVTRELVYTGVTRARSRLTLGLSRGERGYALLREAIARRVVRESAIAARLLAEPNAPGDSRSSAQPDTRESQ